MELRDFWAKRTPFQSVVTHGIISGNVCKYLAGTYLSPGTRKLLSRQLHLTEKETGDFAAYLASLHDIGKLEYHFQCLDTGMAQRLRRENTEFYPPRQHVRHEQTGAAAINRIWAGQGQDFDACEIFSGMIGAHHQKSGGKGAMTSDSFFDGFQRELEVQMRKRFLGESGFALPLVPGKDQGAMEAVLLGLLILSDWIASGSMFADAEVWIDRPDHGERIMEMAESFLKSSGLRQAQFTWGTVFPDVLPRIPRPGMRPLQSCAEQLFMKGNRPSLILIEAPMGEGKTEAGLFCAVQMLRQWEKNGFYFALPTSAASNQMFDRLQQWFADVRIPDRLRLLHAMAWMIDEQTAAQTVDTEDPAQMCRWLAPLRRGLLGQYAVGTVDQAMLSVSRTKYGVLRLLGLANKVLVIDEIHSYDVYMGTFLDLLLQWCRAMEIPVVMLSATLPPDLKARLLRPYTGQGLSQSYPLLTAVCRDGTVEEHPIEETAVKRKVAVHLLPILQRPEEIARKAAGLASPGGCICVLMNTVRQAQAVFSALEDCFGGELLLFHSQFPAWRRSAIEQECARKFGREKVHRPHSAILVATQVVEQSLDVDFDGMLTAIAPIDLVLQRMGRLFRHTDTVHPVHMQKPEQWILIPEGEDFGMDGYVYPEVLLRQAVRILGRRQTVRIPEDIPQLTAEGYDGASIPAEEAECWLERMSEDAVKAGQSRKYLIAPPDGVSPACGGRTGSGMTMGKIHISAYIPDWENRKCGSRCWNRRYTGWSPGIRCCGPEEGLRPFGTGNWQGWYWRKVFRSGKSGFGLRSPVCWT